MNNSNLASKIIEELEDHKATDVTLYKNNQIADYVIVASCESNRHGKSLAEYVIKYLKKSKCKYRTEGLQDANWVVIDINDIVVHVFKFDVREYYQVDELWSSKN